MPCTSGIVDDVIVSHDGGNRPESKMVRIFGHIRLVTAPRTKSAISEWILFDLFFTDRFVFQVLPKCRCLMCVCACDRYPTK